MGEHNRARRNSSLYVTGFPRQLRTGVATGLGLAALYSAYVALLFVFKGDAPFAAHGVTLWQVLATYVASGLAGGILYAVLHPLRNMLLGRAILGAVIGTLFFFGIGVATEGLPSDWQRATWEQTVILGGLLGAPIGLLWRRATGS